MDARPSDQRDPTVAFFLSLLCPGLGHLLAGNGFTFAIFLGLELWLLSQGMYLFLIPLHVFQAVSAAGAVKQWNARQTPPDHAEIPAPPAAGTARRARPEPAHVPPPLPAARPAPALDADAFFAELQAAWGEHRAARITARQFADRKWRAIGAVAVDGREEGEALVAAARELADSGVLTSEEVGRLAARVAP